MKSLLFFPILFIIIFLSAFTTSNVINLGDPALNFSLKNIDGKIVSLADYNDEKGVIIVFTCNHCPYAKLYEERIIELDKKYAAKGFPVIAINPNDPKVVPEDSFEIMKKQAKKMKYTFPYLLDDTQDVAKAYGAQKTPHVYILNNGSNGFTVEYIGTIDNNVKDATNADQHYVTNAIDELLAGKKVTVKETKAIGCSIKWKN